MYVGLKTIKVHYIQLQNMRDMYTGTMRGIAERGTASGLELQARKECSERARKGAKEQRRWTPSRERGCERAEKHNSTINHVMQARKSGRAPPAVGGQVFYMAPIP